MHQNCVGSNSKVLKEWSRYPHAKPQPGGPGTALRLAPTLHVVRYGWLYQEIMFPPAYFPVTGMLTSSLHDKEVIIEEDIMVHFMNTKCQ